MGNKIGKKMASEETHHQEPSKSFESVETFKFHGEFVEESNNGLYFNDIYLPEEIVMMILSYVDPKEVLHATLVCKKWCNIIKSHQFWTLIYSRKYKKKAKKLPWYVYYCLLSTNYFDNNLIKNGNGEEGYKHWRIILNFGDCFAIENPPCGSDPLPPDIPEFHGKTSCFATSFYECNKLQEISIEKNRLMQLILNKYKPIIYLSEWVAARFDCGCVYSLWCKLYGDAPVGKPRTTYSHPFYIRYDSNSDNSDAESLHNSSDDDSKQDQPLHIQKTGTSVEQWAGSTWSKIELIVKDYPEGVKRIVFQHEGRDTQYWKGHYGSKMAGGVLKILFDSIEPLN